jgi:tetratricopeptide (TPR) repeat protein
MEAVRGWLLVALLVALLAAGCSQREYPPPTYVGRAACAKCHKKEQELWAGSHHDLAMQPATAETVLGNFEEATFEHEGVESRFFKKDGAFFVHTDGPDGKLHDYEIKYTFGFTPLQQYLVEFPGGRLQALSICWDARPKAEGGQRWFHLYPGESIPHDDELHWTGRRQNWNYTCADCHSTNLQKNYDAKTDTYKTQWSEIDVSCEACHGPGSQHVAWADDGGEASDPDKKLTVTFGGPGEWSFVSGAPIATRSPPLASHVQVDTCARCHSRRTTMHEWHPGDLFLDAHRPELLVDPLYHADGQIREEVYVFGSFSQSKMYAGGVTCSDCHDPHSLKPRAKGNALCAQCHDKAVYDTKNHHFHEAGKPGTLCIECHMPTKRYMVVDPRLDHSMRVPRPDLSAKTGTPNACNLCHDDRSAKWAADAVASWYPESRRDLHFGEVFHLVRIDAAGASAKLERVARDKRWAPIVRATALAELPDVGNPRVAPPAPRMATLREGVEDPSPLVRLGALQGLQSIAPRYRVALALPLIRDPVRMVRVEAARALAPVAANILGPERGPLERALQEYVESQQWNADQMFGRFNLGLFFGDLGQQERAVAEYRAALVLDPRSVRAYANLADLYRSQRQDDEGEKVLRQGLAMVPGSGELHHALGLLLVRKKNMGDALPHLRKGAELTPANPRFSYVYAVALQSVGKVGQAITLLEKAHETNPRDRSLLVLLVSYLQGEKRLDRAIYYARKLVILVPEDGGARQLLRRLEQQRR